MHNINYIRENPVEFDNFMKSRGEKSISHKIIDLDKEKREAQREWNKKYYLKNKEKINAHRMEKYYESQKGTQPDN